MRMTLTEKIMVVVVVIFLVVSLLAVGNGLLNSCFRTCSDLCSGEGLDGLECFITCMGECR